MTEHVFTYLQPVFWIDFTGPSIWKIVGLFVVNTEDEIHSYPITSDGIVWKHEHMDLSGDFDGVIVDGFIRGNRTYESFKEIFMKDWNVSEKTFLSYCKEKGIPIID